MIKSSKNIKTFNFKTKITNIVMTSGKKNTAEIILLKFAKKLQKSSDKRFKTLVQLALINSTFTFKLNEQTVKKGKKKTVKNIPSFITTNSSRVILSFKVFKTVAIKNKKSNYFYESLSEEILMASNLKGQIVDKNVDLQKQVLANKRYLSKFHW
jgi:ribosomal protein S7